MSQEDTNSTIHNVLAQGMESVMRHYTTWAYTRQELAWKHILHISAACSMYDSLKILRAHGFAYRYKVCYPYNKDIIKATLSQAGTQFENPALHIWA